MTLYESTRPHPRRWLWALVVIAVSLVALWAIDVARTVFPPPVAQNGPLPLPAWMPITAGEKALVARLDRLLSTAHSR